MHVGGLESSVVLKSNGHWVATVTVTVHDESESPVAAASISAGWSNGASGSGNCETDGNGQCSSSKKSLQADVLSVTYTVTGVIGGAPYISGANHDPDGDVPAIVVLKP